MSHSVPIRQARVFLNSNTNEDKYTCQRCSQFRDFSPTTISDHLTPTRLIPDHAPPPTGQNLEAALLSSFVAKFQESHAQTMGTHAWDILMFSLRETKESNNATRLFPDTKSFSISNTDAAIVRLCQEIRPLFLSLHSRVPSSFLPSSRCREQGCANFGVWGCSISIHIENE